MNATQFLKHCEIRLKIFAEAKKDGFVTPDIRFSYREGSTTLRNPKSFAHINRIKTVVNGHFHKVKKQNISFFGVEKEGKFYGHTYAEWKEDIELSKLLLERKQQAYIIERWRFIVKHNPEAFYKFFEDIKNELPSFFNAYSIAS